MGRGDKKTKKGKRTMGSHGNTRPKKESTSSAPVTVEKPKKVAAEKPKKPATEKKVAEKKAPAKKAPAKKAPAKKAEEK